MGQFWHLRIGVFSIGTGSFARAFSGRVGACASCVPWHVTRSAESQMSEAADPTAPSRKRKLEAEERKCEGGHSSVVAMAALLHGRLPRSSYRVAIIGSAGRHSAASEWTPQHFRAMCDATLACIRQRFQLQTTQVVLVSGGSAWADHVAVRLFLDGLTAGDDDDDEDASVSLAAPFAGLQLYLPCTVQPTSPTSSGLTRGAARPSDARLHFFDSGSSQWMTNPGRTLNKLHESFSRTAAVSSFNDIYVASKMGAKLDCSVRGFHARNTLVARNCDFLIAITAGGADFRDMEDAMRRSVPADGGTADTWRKCELVHGRTKIHMPIHLLPLPSSMPRRMPCGSGAASKSSASAAYSDTKSAPSLSRSSSASPSSPSSPRAAKQ